MVPVSAHTERMLIWTPDASPEMGLIGNTPDAYGQTWHLPVDLQRLTYQGHDHDRRRGDRSRHQLHHHPGEDSSLPVA